ncbi:MAG: amino acid adenylation domain-containing protein, partial [Cystobacter sp.]
DMTFAQLLAEVRDVTLDAYAHQHVPFEKIVEVVKPARDLSRSPLVQVMFSLENVPEARTSLSGLSLEPLELDTGSARFDLSLSVMPRPEGLALTYEYNTDLFDRSTLERMHGHLETLLTAAVRAPHTRLGALDLLTGGELRRLLDFEPGPSREASSGATSFVGLFERQVALRPDALALRQGARDLSYEELNTRANQLAHVLRARGVGPEILVAVCLERSVEAVVAFLAIFKAGGAYVPLDPSHPPERLGLILREARALCALTSRALVDKLQGCGLQTLPMEDLEDEVRQAPRSNPEGERPPESLAYVIYTSGSTGQPKGVMVSHRNLATFLESMAALYRLVPEDRMLQFASLSVDTSVMELYPPLIVGGAAVLRTEEMMNSVSTYLESCERWGVTFIKPPTSYWSEMTFALSLGDARMPPSVRLVGVGGEKMQPGRAIEWKRLVDPRVRLYNEYGPTETTVMMTACDITALDEVRLTHAEAPLGMPLAHARVSLLDPEGRRVPVGVPGELCVGGVLVTRGYQDRPDLTAQLFVPDAFSDVPGARMYRSGDKARWWPEGSLEYLGRLDEQVKIRGFRVEPGEVEALLNAHASVREAAVVVRDDAQGQKHLVAFVVVEDAAVDAAALKGYLRERVPDYMLPSRIVLMPDLPIGPSDKIERSALPLVALHGADDREYVAPRTEAEQRLAEIWCTVLQVERVGANDHFFDLGGHSLLATQLVSRVRQAFGVEIPLTLLFEKPTVAALAEDLERRARANTGPQLRKLSRADLKNRKPRG